MAWRGILLGLTLWMAPLSSMAENNSKWSPAPPEGAGCEVVTAWVKENSNHLPNNLEDFRSFSQRYWPQIFSALSPATRAKLWRDRVDEMIAHADPAKAENLQEVKRWITPESYSLKISEDELFRNISDLGLNPTDFLSLNPSHRAEGSGANSQKMVASRPPQAVAKTVTPSVSSCDCVWFCGTSGACVHKPPCTGTTSGCGFWGNKPCDGTCTYFSVPSEI